jgi:HSP20 family protein
MSESMPQGAPEQPQGAWEQPQDAQEQPQGTQHQPQGGAGRSSGQGEPGAQTTAPTRRSPRELAEHFWPPRFDWPFGEVGWPFREAGRPGGVPIRVEELREGDQLVVRAEIPGVDPEKDIEVTVDEGVLTIRAQRQERTEDKQAESYRSEFRYGRFERQIRLPKGASPDVVSASYRDGVLEVRLPVPTETPSARRIDVRRG